MAAPEQFVSELGVTAVNTAQLEKTLLQKVKCNSQAHRFRFVQS